jgi:diacylglycerol kinase (ATP)
MKPGYQGVRRLVWASRWAVAGLVAGARREAAIRQELVLVMAGAIAAPWVTDDPFQRAVLVAALMVVLVVELLNSAIEAVVDRISSERHELSGLAKDLGAAAVFVSLLIAGLLWLTALWPLMRSWWS